MNLKYVALSCLLTAVSGGMNAQSEEGYRVKIQLKKPADGMLMVSERVPNSTMWFTDTLQLKKGKSVHTGKVQDPCLVTYALRSENEDFLGSFSIFLDNSPRIEVKGDNLRSLRVTGSPAHAEYERIYDYILGLPGYAESKVAAYYVYDYYSLHPQGHRGSEGQEHRVHHADDGRQAGTLGTRREETKYNLAKSL